MGFLMTDQTQKFRGHCHKPDKPSYLKDLVCYLRCQADTQSHGGGRADASRHWMSQGPLACCHHSYWVKIEWFAFFFSQKNRHRVFLGIGGNEYTENCQVRAFSTPHASRALSLPPTPTPTPWSGQVRVLVPRLPPLLFQMRSLRLTKGRWLAHQVCSSKQSGRSFQPSLPRFDGDTKKRDPRTEMDIAVRSE